MNKRMLFSILLATAWISLSEFFRNQFMLIDYWINHYKAIGLTFQTEPVNGAVWGIWSMLFAVFICVVRTRFTFIQTAILGWFAIFVNMWLVIGNLGVLPFPILYSAIPLSWLEVLVATWICSGFSMKNEIEIC